MLLILLLFGSFHLLQGSPTTNTQPTAPVLLADNISIPQDALSLQFGSRTTFDIIKSCLLTIVACTWTAIHPNIPSPTDTRWIILKRRIVTALCALVAPEAITLWALRQRFAAGRIARDYNDFLIKNGLLSIDDIIARKAAHKGFGNKVGELILKFIPKAILADPPLPDERSQKLVQEWTVVHGFFLQMGGFILSKDGEPLRTLRFRTGDEADIISLIQEKRIKALTATEDDLKGRSQSDSLSKGIVLLQTVWFFGQCVERWAIGLPVTELEIITLGFVVLNVLTYACWWSKPQNVGILVYVELDSEEVSFPEPRTEKVGFLQRKMQELEGKKRTLFRKITLASAALFRPLSHLLVGSDLAPSPPEKNHQLRVAMFHSQHLPRNYFLLLLVSLITILFGAVHIAPTWFIKFPSVVQMWLWRGSAIFLTAVPLVVTLFTNTLNQERHSTLMRLVVITTLPVYAVTRVLIFVLALIALRNLPPPALTTVQWVVHYPHL